MRRDDFVTIGGATFRRDKVVGMIRGLGETAVFIEGMPPLQVTGSTPEDVLARVCGEDPPKKAGPVLVGDN